MRAYFYRLQAGRNLMEPTQRFPDFFNLTYLTGLMDDAIFFRARLCDRKLAVFIFLGKCNVNDCNDQQNCYKKTE